MANIYAPVMRALVVVALVLATATLMFVRPRGKQLAIHLV